MPFGGTKKNYKKKYRKYKKKYKSLRILETSMSSFPKTKTVAMRYCDSFALQPSVVTPIALQVYRANSIFDPDQTGIGHQPLGHDEWNKFYTKYTVISSKITVKALGNNNTLLPFILGVLINNDNLPVIVSGTGMLEQGRSRYCLMSGTTNGLPGYVTQTYSAKKWHNLKNVHDAYGLLADFGANPPDQVYFIIFVQTPDGVSGGSVCYGTVAIEYLVELSDPIDLSQS